MRICSVCKAEKPEEEFPKRSSMCKICHNEYNRNHYQANKAAYIAKAKRNNEAVRELVRATKEVPCADCKVSYPYYVMDFDHLENKSFNISESMGKFGWTRLKAEIDKCDIVCSNCHRIRTWSRKESIKL